MKLSCKVFGHDAKGEFPLVVTKIGEEHLHPSTCDSCGDDIWVIIKREQPDWKRQYHYTTTVEIVSENNALLFLYNKLQTMSALLDSIKAADDQLHGEVVAVGGRIASKLDVLAQKISDLQGQIASGSTPTQGDLDEAAGIIKQAQDDAAILSGIAPATDTSGS